MYQRNLHGELLGIRYSLENTSKKDFNERSNMIILNLFYNSLRIATAVAGSLR